MFTNDSIQLREYFFKNKLQDSIELKIAVLLKISVVY